MAKNHMVMAFDEAGNALFLRYVPRLFEAMKATVWHPMVTRVAWIEFRKRKYTYNEVLRLLDQHVNKQNQRKRSFNL